MTSLVSSVRRRTLVVGLVVASFAAASGSAYAAPGLDYYPPPGGPPTAKTRTAKVPKRPKTVNVERIAVRCDVPVGTSHSGDLWRCEWTAAPRCAAAPFHIWAGGGAPQG